MVFTDAASCLKQHFDYQSRSRGQEYFDEAAVLFQELRPGRIWATVDGSAGRTYEVYIRGREVNGELSIDLGCTCPQFARAGSCKHLWAAILEMDDHKVGLVATPDEQFDNGQVIVAAEGGGDQWERDNDLDYDIGQSFAGVTFTSITMPLSSQRSESQWQRQLRGLRKGPAGPRLDSDLVASPLTSDQRKLMWYVIDLTTSQHAGRLSIRLFRQTSKKNGEMGRLQAVRMRRSEIESCTDPLDREALPFLFDRLVDYETPYGYYRNDWQSISTCLLSGGGCQFLLPKLAVTGRLAWMLDTDGAVDDLRPITWEPGEAWQIRLQVREDEQAQSWRIEGELFRGDAARPLGDAVLVLDNDLVMFSDVAAPFRSEDGGAWLSLLQKNGPVVVPYADRVEFLSSLASVARSAEIELPPSLQVDRVVGSPQGRILIHKPEWDHDRHLHADVTFSYAAVEAAGTATAEQSSPTGAAADVIEQRRDFGINDSVVDWYDEQAGKIVTRNVPVEASLLEQLREAGIRAAGKTSRHQRDVKFTRKSFADVVMKLIDAGWIVESEGNPVRSAGQFSLSVTRDIDWFELDGRVDFDGISASLPALLAAVRAGQRLIQLDDGSAGMLPQEWLKRFGTLANLADTEDDQLRFAPTQALLLDALLAEQDQQHLQLDAGFVRMRNKLRDFSGVKGGKEPRGFHGELRPYQRVGLGWFQFLRDFGFGGCLADDMGLGKTIQVLALLQSRRLGRKEQRRPSVVVVPKSLVFNWLDEAARFTPNLKVINYTGLRRREQLEELGECDLVVTTYGTLRRDIVDLKEIEFDYAILDEAQAIKNAGSQAAKACRLLQSRYRLAMTGTPIENHLGELWSLFEYLNPGMLGKTTAFSAVARSATAEDDDGALAALARSIQPFILRRTKQEVLSELPEKTEQTLLCELSATERKNYNEIRDYYRAHLAGKVAQKGLAQSKIHVLEALLRLRQAACHPGLIDKSKRELPSAKVEALLEQLEEIISEGHKALVFSQFTSLLSIVRNQLDARNWNYEYLDGRTRKRDERVKRFQEDPDCSLFLISLKAGGSGLNLTSADYVYILDPWWNPAVEAQAIDRTHRIGQERRVFAYRLIAQNTVEEKILELQTSKRKLADALISANDSVIRNLTADDLQLLLS